MNIINNKNQILRIRDIKQHLLCVPYKNIAADRAIPIYDPLIPVKEAKEVMSENAGYAGVIQNYCTVINAQPDIQFEEIPSIIPSQQLARENADYWMEELNPKIINTYTQVKQFCNYYASITDEDIEQLVNNINDLNGKDNFIAVMNDFQAQSDKNGEQANIVSSHLNDFDGRFAEDLSNFEVIKKQADDMYLGEEGKLQQLQRDMERYTIIIDECNAAIGTLSTFSYVGNIIITVGMLLNFINPVNSVITVLLIASLGSILVSGELLNLIFEIKHKTLRKYQETTIELERLQTQCAVLQVLSDNFTSLGRANSDAIDAVRHMINTWQTIGGNFANLSHTAATQDVVDENTQIFMKLKLKEALKDVKDLKVFAEQCELNGVLPVIPEAELIYRLRLPQSWLKQAIHGDAFRNYVAAKRKKGFFDRGRRGWRTRNRPICIPLYRTGHC